MIVLGIDPGAVTGWALVQTEPNNVAVGEFPTWTGVGALLDAQPDVVVVEAFRLYPWARSEMTWNSFVPCEVIGVIKYLACEHNIPIVQQSAAQGKSFKLHLTNKYSKHMHDALRHALVYLRGQGKFPPGTRDWIQEELISTVGALR